MPPGPPARCSRCSAGQLRARLPPRPPRPRRAVVREQPAGGPGDPTGILLTRGGKQRGSLRCLCAASEQFQRFPLINNRSHDIAIFFF